MTNRPIQTVAVHGAAVRPNPSLAIVPPIACTSTYRFASTADLIDHLEGRNDQDEYGRYSNPTVREAEHRIAALDGTEACALFASGMAAIATTLLAMLRAGQHVVLSSDCYRPTEELVTRTLAKFGVEHTLVEPDDYDGFARAIQPGRTRVVFTESPTNPYQNVVDLPRMASIARQGGAKLVVDTTFATPLNQRPAALGADLVLHSATKYLGGHNDLLAGSVSGRAGLVGVVRELRGQMGAVLDPHAAYLLVRGLKSFPLRMRQHNASALAVATFLEGHPAVERVWYPGLASHPHHAVATAQMSGFGGVVTFRVRSDRAGTIRFVDACRLFQIGASLGGPESLLHQPAIISYHDMPAEQRAALGMHDNLVRLAVGLEDPADLIADLAQALDAMATPD